jgi:hypothetical protein
MEFGDEIKQKYHLRKASCDLFEKIEAERRANRKNKRISEPYKRILMEKIFAAITAVGGYVPDDILSNADLEKMVDTSDDWISSRTGIKERRIYKEDGRRSFEVLE